MKICDAVKHCGPRHLAIIWAYTPYFLDNQNCNYIIEALDYFFDGAFRQSLKHLDQNHRKNLVSTVCFDHLFFGSALKEDSFLASSTHDLINFLENHFSPSYPQILFMGSASALTIMQKALPEKSLFCPNSLIINHT